MSEQTQEQLYAVAVSIFWTVIALVGLIAFEYIMQHVNWECVWR